MIFYFLLDTDLMVAVGELNSQNVSTERLTFRACPDEQKLEDLKAQGYNGVVTLLNPGIPFEKVLLEREKEACKEMGIPDHPFPMLPGIEKEREIARENNLTFTLRPVNSTSPDPATVKEIARYAQSRDHKVYTGGVSATP